MSEIEYKATTALLVVDMQNDFADPDGSLFVEGGDTIIDTINAEIGAATRADGFVVYTQDWHPAQTPHFDIHGGVWPVHCVRDTWGAEFSPMLVVDGPVVRKGSNGEDGYSGFTMRDPESGEQTPTELDGLLRERGIESVV
ncbi:MAG: isochorismatase family protein, partial [Acidimicrobiales bacterium]